MTAKNEQKMILLQKAVIFTEAAGGLENARKLLGTIAELEKVRTVETKTRIEEPQEECGG